MNSEQRAAFEAASGETVVGYLNLWTGAVFLLLFLWAAWSLLVLYKGWSGGNATGGDLGSGAVRLLLIILISGAFLLR